MFGLIKDLAEVLNQLSLNTLDHYRPTYRRLSESSYMDLPIELRSPRKELINIKNKDQKCFLWCHVRHINPSKEHPERIKKTDKKLLKNLIMMNLSFLWKKNILARLK